MGFLVCVEGTWIEWNPPIGLADSIGARAAWIGAVAYGRAIRQGASEVVAQQEAEQTVYSVVYRVRY